MGSKIHRDRQLCPPCKARGRDPPSRKSRVKEAVQQLSPQTCPPRLRPANCPSGSLCHASTRWFVLARRACLGLSSCDKTLLILLCDCCCAAGKLHKGVGLSKLSTSSSQTRMQRMRTSCTLASRLTHQVEKITAI